MTGPNDDPDNDGRSNLLEYSAGTDPGIPNPPALLTIKREGEKVALFYQENSDAIDLVYQIFAGESLADFDSWSELSSRPTVSAQAGSIMTMKAYDMMDTVNERKFFRLRVRKTVEH